MESVLFIASETLYERWFGFQSPQWGDNSKDMSVASHIKVCETFQSPKWGDVSKDGQWTWGNVVICVSVHAMGK